MTPLPKSDVGILDTLGAVVTLAFALPVGLLGINLLVSGRTAVGTALCVVAVLMVALKRSVTTPDDVPAMAAEKTVGAVVEDDDNEG